MQREDRGPYKKGTIELVPFSLLDEQMLMEILYWRNHELVRKQMTNSNEITVAEHINFVESITQRQDMNHWLAKRKGKDCGVVNLKSLLNNFDEAEWGFYLTPKYIGSGIGLELAFESIHLFFSELGVKVLHGKIKKSNLENQRIQKNLGFTFLDQHESTNELIDTVLSSGVLVSDFKTFQKRLFHGREN